MSNTSFASYNCGGMSLLLHERFNLFSLGKDISNDIEQQ
jgi:hypothetical protein